MTEQEISSQIDGITTLAQYNQFAETSACFHCKVRQTDGHISNMAEGGS